MTLKSQSIPNVIHFSIRGIKFDSTFIPLTYNVTHHAIGHQFSTMPYHFFAHFQRPLLDISCRHDNQTDGRPVWSFPFHFATVHELIKCKHTRFLTCLSKVLIQSVTVRHLSSNFIQSVTIRHLFNLNPVSICQTPVE